ncbi:MAG: hypothetical protein P8166_05920 [Candidatus Thiodiazotropha sp.]
MTQLLLGRLPLAPQLRTSLLVALPLLLIVNGTLYLAYSLLQEQQRANWVIQMESGLDAALITMEGIRNDLHGDLLLLAGSPNLKAVLDDAAAPRLDRLAAEWEVFAGIKRQYDQIRWLDNRGMERLRINLTSHGAVRVADEQLQDKSGRYYFKDAITMPVGQVYASRIDLNIEHGEVERPFKPMLRMAVSVSNSLGEVKGLVLVNVLADNIFKDLAQHAGLAQSHILMIDPTGYYLRGFTEEREWGFMFQLRDDRGYRFDKRYPAVWREMVRQGVGKIDAPEGLFLFRTLSYGTEGFGHRYFLLAVELPRELSGLLADQRLMWLSISLLVSVILTLLSLFLAHYVICCGKNIDRVSGETPKHKRSG